MIRFPLFEHLSIDGYGLYPGSEDRPGLHTEFLPGLTLVLGANGLGKSTLVLLLYRMCTGPNDIRGWTPGELGNRQLKMGPISQAHQRALAARVQDNASDAVARLRFRLGDTTLELARELRTLQLSGLTVNGELHEADEDEFQITIVENAGLSSFEDWILLLRYLTFYFEDRRSLVWDSTAQRQLLRLLFLPPDESAHQVALEHEVLSLDSQVRNLQNTLFKEETALAKYEKSLVTRPDLESNIDSITNELDRHQSDLEDAQSRFADIEAERQTARLEALRASEEREAAFRALERRRLEELQAAFPSESESATYILSYLFASQTCLACGTEIPQAAEELRRRIDAGRCVICDSPVQPVPPPSNQSHWEQLQSSMQATEDRLAEATKRRAEAEDVYRNLLKDVARLDQLVAARSADLEDLIRRLPPESGDVRERRREFNAMRTSLERRRHDLRESQKALRDYVEETNQRIFAHRDQIKTTFDTFAQEFLLDNCSLAWSNRKARIGQIGEAIESASFQIDMSGSDFESVVRRTASEEVSESQREFIDLAFRMALMTVAGADGRASLVVDAPESSLDAVFAPRAARVLMRFAKPRDGNRLIITSNLVDGQLIPTLLMLANITRADDKRLVDLFTIASPTAAVRQLHAEYNQALLKVFPGDQSEDNV